MKSKKVKAKIYTVVEGDEVESFDVEIVSSKPSKKAATKGMIIKVTDERLLKETGGIAPRNEQEAPDYSRWKAGWSSYSCVFK